MTALYSIWFVCFCFCFSCFFFITWTNLCFFFFSLFECESHEENGWAKEESPSAKESACWLKIKHFGCHTEEEHITWLGNGDDVGDAARLYFFNSLLLSKRNYDDYLGITHSSTQGKSAEFFFLAAMRSISAHCE